MLFWFFLLAIGYTYCGYPFLLWLAAKFRGREVGKGHGEPFVSVIISAFNESGVIERKIRNLLGMEYPAEQLEILIGSDGASDRTDEIISRFSSERIRFFRFVSNRGKAHVLNALVQEAQGSILVFTDTRQQLDWNAIRALVRNFDDPVVGCVSGELFFMKGETGSVGRGMDLYWRYEKFLRKRESELGSMLGATGAIYAVRKRLYQELPENALVDDMLIPLSIVEQGYRAVFEADAVAFDRVSQRGGEELTRKIRTLAGNYQAFIRFRKLFTPFRSPIAWQLFSHKFLRLMVPFFLLGLFLSNVFLLNHSTYALLFIGQLLFYGAAIGQAVIEGREHRHRGGVYSVFRKFAYVPYMFCLLNFSALMGLIHFANGIQKSNWEKAYA